MRRLGLTAALCLSTLLSACSQIGQQNQGGEAQQDEHKMTIPPPLHLGAVHQVYPDQHFALLRMLGPVPAPGTTLITHPADGSNDRVGNLCVSNATGSRHNIIAADIRSGTVVSGDRVFLYRDIAEPEAQEQELTEATEGENDEPMVTDSLPAAEDEPMIAPQEETLSVETSVLPEADTPAVSEPSGAPSPDTVPDSIRDVPDTIEGWNQF